MFEPFTDRSSKQQQPLTSEATSASPLASMSAFLQSIIPAPLLWRSCCTSLAEMAPGAAAAAPTLLACLACGASGAGAAASCLGASGAAVHNEGQLQGEAGKMIAESDVLTNDWHQGDSTAPPA